MSIICLYNQILLPLLCMVYSRTIKINTNKIIIGIMDVKTEPDDDVVAEVDVVDVVDEFDDVDD